ncbi:extensin-like [Tachyglossus aculeatus]|uniref:extensin-like n=1 Tax=Tachyglossus aculeatus TaxID=9261 RepID=UPI0018F28CED|nr:extensin-like [Tachyglossus aculeatus]
MARGSAHVGRLPRARTCTPGPGGAHPPPLPARTFPLGGRTDSPPPGSDGAGNPGHSHASRQPVLQSAPRTPGTATPPARASSNQRAENRGPPPTPPFSRPPANQGRAPGHAPSTLLSSNRRRAPPPRPPTSAERQATPSTLPPSNQRRAPRPRPPTTTEYPRRAIRPLRPISAELLGPVLQSAPSAQAPPSTRPPSNQRRAPRPAASSNQRRASRPRPPTERPRPRAGAEKRSP